MKPITIVGGGLAGLTLGIALRQKQIPVVLHEANRYPRHRVCGEFISGCGQETLMRLGLHDLVVSCGAVSATSAAFFTETKTSPTRPLPVPAICVSRQDLDHALAKEFSRLGGELNEGIRWSGDFDEGIVRATGRRVLPGDNADGWFGLKIHARTVTLSADLEMHVSPQGYVGLCRINEGNINICGLFRRSTVNGVKSPQTLLRGRPDSWLNRRLRDAVFDESSFCAVAGLSLRPQQAATQTECRIGDAITMIPPVTGNGMSMAFESAELATEPLADWSSGKTSWSEAQSQIARCCDTTFARRLRWAKWLQLTLLTPALQNPLISLAAHSTWLWRTVFEQTR